MARRVVLGVDALRVRAGQQAPLVRFHHREPIRRACSALALACSRHISLTHPQPCTPKAGLDDRTTGTIVALEETLDALDGLLKLLPEGRRSFL